MPWNSYRYPIHRFLFSKISPVHTFALHVLASFRTRERMSNLSRYGIQKNSTGPESSVRKFLGSEWSYCSSNPTGPALTLFQISNKSTELDRTFRNTFEDIHFQLETVAESIISTIICSYINQVNYIYQYLHQKKTMKVMRPRLGFSFNRKSFFAKAQNPQWWHAPWPPARAVALHEVRVEAGWLLPPGGGWVPWWVPGCLGACEFQHPRICWSSFFFGGSSKKTESLDFFCDSGDSMVFFVGWFR